jgi:hypothetical protein
MPSCATATTVGSRFVLPVITLSPHVVFPISLFLFLFFRHVFFRLRYRFGNESQPQILNY